MERMVRVVTGTCSQPQSATMTRRIAITVHSVAGGGVERVAAQMANAWVDCGYTVSLISLDDATQDSYSLSSKVDRLGLGVLGESTSLYGRLSNNRRRINAIRNAIERINVDTIVSLGDITNVLTLLAAKRCGRPVIVCEHTDPRHHSIGPVWRRLRRFCYPRCQALTVLTQGIVASCRPLVKQRPIYVVPNFVSPCSLVADGKDFLKRRQRIVSMGRLTPSKGFDRLIDAFAQIGAAVPDWTLQILGEGQSRLDLQEQIERLGLEQQVSLSGWTDSPERLLADSQLFALTSHYEGFPMSILEAMAAGLPVVSFQCESGPAEIIRESVDGHLVIPGDIHQFAQRLKELIESSEKRARMSQSAMEVSDRFSQAKFMARWEAILDGMPIDQFAERFCDAESG